MKLRSCIGWEIHLVLFLKMVLLHKPYSQILLVATKLGYADIIKWLLQYSDLSHDEKFMALHAAGFGTIWSKCMGGATYQGGTSKEGKCI